MRPLFTLLLLVLAIPLSAAEPPLTPTQISRLESLCRVWGTVKFFHPWIVAPPDGKPIDWDAALIETIPLVEKASNAEEFRAAVDLMLGALGDTATWARILSDSPGGPRPETVEPAFPQTRIVEGGKGTVLVIDATDCRRLAAQEQRSPGNLFTQALAQADNAEVIILDVRGARGRTQQAVTVAAALEKACGILVKSDLTLATVRARFHRGYGAELPGTYRGYHSGFSLREAPILRAKAGASAGKQIIFLTNAESHSFEPLVAALQAAGQAVVIHHNNRPRVPAAGSTYSMELTDGATVVVRTGDLIHADGSCGLTPDIIAQEGSNQGSETLLSTALSIARGEATPPPRLPKRTPAVAADVAESSYPEMVMPSRAYRLLALFRVWNVMHYFFPYKHLMDRSWDSVLTEFIPHFADARNPFEFGTAVLELAARLQDSHVHVSGGGASSAVYSHVGVASPLLLIRHIQNEFVVVAVDESLQDRVHVGDIVLAIDGESVAERSFRLKKYIAASTPQSMNLRLSRDLLRGQPNSTAALKLRGRDETIREASVPRRPNSEYGAAFDAINGLRHRKTPVYGVLPEGYGYFDLVRLTVPQIKMAFDAIRQTPALIMDMRGYPQGTSWEISSRLTDVPAKRSLFHCPYRDSPDLFNAADLTFAVPIVPSPLWKYTARVVVLIDENAVSQAEGSCLGFENAAKGRITFIGTPTAGANGDVTNTTMPGGIRISFTGQSVRHTDGRQLQRVGIQPDIRVEPTIAGIAAGKDEVLDAAIKFLNESK
jgi:hypothetical protein